jgi:hypothetical protein
MIKPRPYGSDIQIIRHDGTLRIIPVYRGSERRAFRLILAYRKADLLTFEEAARAMCAMNTIMEPRETHGEPVGAVRSLVRRVIDGAVRLGGDDCEG